MCILLCNLTAPSIIQREQVGGAGQRLVGVRLNGEWVWKEGGESRVGNCVNMCVCVLGLRMIKNKRQPPTLCTFSVHSSLMDGKL